MSAWRRSTSSIRRTRERFGAWYRKPEAAAAAEAAEAAEAALALALAAEAVAAEAAEVAELAWEQLAWDLAWDLAAELAAQLAGEAAARPGELAAGARSDRLPDALTNAGPCGRVDKSDAANACLVCSAASAWPSPCQPSNNSGIACPGWVKSAVSLRCGSGQRLTLFDDESRNGFDR